jgi:NTE family protein
MAATQRSRHDIGLVLSGGGARCFAQVGALAALEAGGYRAVAIAANSTAAILGALYAAGHDAEAIARIVRDVDPGSFLTAGGAHGLIDHDGVERLLAAHAPTTFEGLATPLAVPTVDIERAEQLVFREGPLAPAVCASNAFPGLFAPVSYRGRSLMDGGILNNLPVDVIRTLTTRPVLALDVRPPARTPLDLGSNGGPSLLQRLAALLRPGTAGPADLLIRAYDITQSRLVELTAALHPPDVWFRPPLPDDFGIQDFDRFDEAFESGRCGTAAAIEAGEFDVLHALEHDDAR